MQKVIAPSSVEAEYIALSSATRQATWMRTRLLELGVMDKDESVRIWEDNQGAISLAQNHRTDARTKHIDVRHRFIRDQVEQKLIDVAYERIGEMVAYYSTKPIDAVKFIWCRVHIGLSLSRHVNGDALEGSMLQCSHIGQRVHTVTTRVVCTRWCIHL